MSQTERPLQDPENSPEDQNPATTPTEKVPLRKVIVPLSIVLGVPLVIGGAIGFTVGLDLGEQKGKKALDNIFGKTVYRPIDHNSLNSQSEAELAINTSEFDLWFFNRKHNDLNVAFFEFAIRAKTEDELDIFHQIAAEYLFEGLRLLNQAKNQKVVEFVENPSKLQVKLDNHVYNLDDPFQFQIISSLLRLKLNTIRLEMEMQNASEDSKNRYLDSINNDNLAQEAIIWLRDQKLQMGVTKDSSFFVDPQSLARFARALRLLNQLGYPSPRIGLIGPHPRDGGKFIEKGYYANDRTIIDHADRFGSVDSLPHELGHYVAAISADINPEFSQSAFNNLMDKVESKNMPYVKNPNDVYFYLSEPRNNRLEQYAEFFRQYVLNGEELRRKISQKRQDDPFAANILDAETDFFKRLFKGKEFVVDGLTKEELQSQIEKDRPVAEKQKSYQIGQIVTIEDTDTKRPGIFLRPSPASAINTDTKAVFNGDRVEIIEGPVVTQRQKWDNEGKTYLESVNWLKVKIRSQLGSYSLVGDQTDAEGWISGEWLGGSPQGN